MGCCADDVVQLVQGDTRPTLQLFLYDATTNKPFDFSDGGDVVQFLLRPAGKPIKETLVCQKLPGTVNEAGEVVYGDPYTLAGSGGRAEVHWTPTALDTAGTFEGKAEVLWHDGTQQTMVDKIPITIQVAWS